MYLKEFCFQVFGISFVALTKFGEKDFRRAGMDPSKYKVDLGHKNVNSHFNFELIQTWIPKEALMSYRHIWFSSVKKKLIVYYSFNGILGILCSLTSRNPPCLKLWVNLRLRLSSWIDLGPFLAVIVSEIIEFSIKSLPTYFYYQS